MVRIGQAVQKLWQKLIFRSKLAAIFMTTVFFSSWLSKTHFSNYFGEKITKIVQAVQMFWQKKISRWSWPPFCFMTIILFCGWLGKTQLKIFWWKNNKNRSSGSEVMPQKIYRSVDCHFVLGRHLVFRMPFSSRSS